MNRTPLGIIDDRAFGSSLRVVVTPEANVGVAKAAIGELLRAVDLAASRFREDSELSRLNSTPGYETVISPLFAKLLAAALYGARVSGGAVDPTVGAAIKLAGYEADFAQVAADGSEMALKVSRIPGWRAIKFDEASRRSACRRVSSSTSAPRPRRWRPTWPLQRPVRQPAQEACS